MTASDALSLRGRQYLRLGLAGAGAAILALGFAWCFWVALPGSGRAFRNIDIPPDFGPFWQNCCGATHVLVAMNAMEPLAIAGRLSAWGVGLAVVVLVIMRRYGLMAFVIVISCLCNEALQHHRHLDGYQYAYLAEISPAKVAALEAGKPPQVPAAPSNTLDASGALADGVITGEEMTLLTGKDSHTFEFKTDNPDGKGPGALYIDGIPASATPLVPPATQVALAHYTLAQYGYLTGDTARVRRHLEAMVPENVPFNPVIAWRVRVMTEWLEARGMATDRIVYRPDIGLNLLGLSGRRVAGWTLTALGTFLAGMTVALLVLAGVLRRRSRRIDALAHSIARA